MKYNTHDKVNFKPFLNNDFTLAGTIIDFDCSSYRYSVMVEKKNIPTLDTNKEYVTSAGNLIDGKEAQATIIRNPIYPNLVFYVYENQIV